MTTIFSRNGRSIRRDMDGFIEMGDMRVRDVQLWNAGHARKVGAMQQVQGDTNRAVRRWNVATNKDGRWEETDRGRAHIGHAAQKKLKPKQEKRTSKVMRQ
ncbi:hypothetical protein Hypma_008367 [Hypsizygus marmoreus]|uniref:Uncharacterized protein n=1 Tax=Hypsizygus marmoreus TaxID=39966 RepID=A0A369JPX6_HYPMA|nr:hypothetical protein Hypma_008367 [Hypsizygus marmoreus]